MRDCLCQRGDAGCFLVPLHFSMGLARCSERVEWPSLNVPGSPLTSCLLPSSLVSFIVPMLYRKERCSDARRPMLDFLFPLLIVRPRQPSSMNKTICQFCSQSHSESVTPLTLFFSSCWLPFPDTVFWAVIPPFFQCHRPEKHLLRLFTKFYVFCRIFCRI